MAPVPPPESRYAPGDSGKIAYQVVGSGRVDLVFSPWCWNNLDTQWDDPLVAAFLDRLASFSRLILFDPRGVGLSDPVTLTELPTLEQWMDDIRVVLDAVGSKEAAVFGHGDGTLVTLLFAATYPERVSALILMDGCARLRKDGDYPGWAEEEVEWFLTGFAEQWGSGAFVPMLAPAMAENEAFRHRLARAERLSMSPSTVVAMQRIILDSDLRDVVPTISVPTLVLHRRDNVYAPAAWGEYLAAQISGARFVDVPGAEHLYWLGSSSWIEVVEEFVTGRRSSPEVDRVLATILFVDIVQSTETAALLGDHAWTDLLSRFRHIVRTQLAAFRGVEINTRGDDFLATFDGPARAIRCACAIRQEAASLGVGVRAGLHTGEVELLDGDVGGIAVHIGARVAGLAEAGEVLVSRIVVDLVAGSGIGFTTRGDHALKGVAGRWEISVVDV